MSNHILNLISYKFCRQRDHSVSYTCLAYVKQLHNIHGQCKYIYCYNSEERHTSDGFDILNLISYKFCRDHSVSYTCLAYVKQLHHIHGQCKYIYYYNSKERHTSDGFDSGESLTSFPKMESREATHRRC